jgi:hypothetical protein
LSRTLDIDVEHQVAALRRGPVELADMRAVVVAENLRVLQKLALLDPLLELRA